MGLLVDAGVCERTEVTGRRRAIAPPRRAAQAMLAGVTAGSGTRGQHRSIHSLRRHPIGTTPRAVADAGADQRRARAGHHGNGKLIAA